MNTKDDIAIIEGLKGSDEPESKLILNNFVEFHKECNSYVNGKYKYSESTIQLLQDFDKNCKDRKICKVNIDQEKMSDSCQTELERRAIGANTDYLYN